MPAQPSIRASTQEHLLIEDIKDDLVLLKDGGTSMVLQTTAVNFMLLSESEQDTLIFSYAALLNSLSFSIQVVVRSKRMDVSHYIEQLKEQEYRQANPALKNQIAKYREFVTSIVEENNVLDKRFYISIPFSPQELGIRAVGTLFGKKALPYPKSYILDKAKTALFPKRDHVLRQLARLGLRGRQLTTQELIELFYDIYNPKTVGSYRLATTIVDYQTPLVQPAIEGLGKSGESS